MNVDSQFPTDFDVRSQPEIGGNPEIEQNSLSVGYQMLPTKCKRIFSSGKAKIQIFLADSYPIVYRLYPICLVRRQSNTPCEPFAPVSA
jgi:hypothetical protein